jgi:rhamnogalacturonyl hydrolase YesR
MPKAAQTDWTFAALYPGFLALPPSVAGEKYRDAIFQIGKAAHWQPGPRLLHADDQAVGQAYLDLYFAKHDPEMIAPIQSRMDKVMLTPDDPKKPLWWWCDALFMAPPVLAELSAATGRAEYVYYMDHEWDITARLLYDPNVHLYTRDATYLTKFETNGRKIFWARGNGWVIAGLAQVLEHLPADSPLRPKYVRMFQEIAASLLSLQGADGLWRPGLLDPESYPLSEVSGSAFITYAFAYGINNGLLDRKAYKSSVHKAWAGLLSHVYADGRLGAIQPIGAAPGAFTETSSYVYGVGAYLMAGSEIYRGIR